MCIYRIPRKEPVLAGAMNAAAAEKGTGCFNWCRWFHILNGGRCGYCKNHSMEPSGRGDINRNCAGVTVPAVRLSVEFAAFSYLALLLMAMVFIDIRHRIIPNGIVIAGLIGGAAVFIYNLFIPFPYYGARSWWQPLAGMLPGSVFLFMMMLAGMLIYKSDEVMGMGDVKIFAPIGMFLGWRMCIIALLLSIIAGGAVGIVLMLSGIKKRKDTIPFGPYIAVGTIFTILAGWDVLYWYMVK